MHEVLVNRIGGLSLPRKSVVRLTDRPDMILDVYRGRKTTMQQQQQILKTDRFLTVKYLSSMNNYVLYLGHQLMSIESYSCMNMTGQSVTRNNSKHVHGGSQVWTRYNMVLLNCCGYSLNRNIIISILFENNVRIEFCFYVLHTPVCGRTVRRSRLLQVRAFVQVGMLSATSAKPGPLA